MNVIAHYLQRTGMSQAGFARSIGVTPGMVFQLVRGDRPVSARLCVAIERTTHGAVTRRDLRPDDWQDIWPELAKEREHA